MRKPMPSAFTYGPIANQLAELNLVARPADLHNLIKELTSALPPDALQLVSTPHSYPYNPKAAQITAVLAAY